MLVGPLQQIAQIVCDARESALVVRTVTNPHGHFGTLAVVFRPRELLRHRILPVLDRPRLAVAAPHAEGGVRREEPALPGLARHGREEELPLSGRSAPAPTRSTPTASATSALPAASTSAAASARAAWCAPPTGAILGPGQPAHVAADLVAVPRLLLDATGLVEGRQHRSHELGNRAARSEQLLHVVAAAGGAAHDLTAPAAVDLLARDLQIGLESGVDRRLEQGLQPTAHEPVVGIKCGVLVHERRDVALGLAERIRRAP